MLIQSTAHATARLALLACANACASNPDVRSGPPSFTFASPEAGDVVLDLEVTTFNVHAVDPDGDGVSFAWLLSSWGRVDSTTSGSNEASLELVYDRELDGQILVCIAEDPAGEAESIQWALFAPAER